MCGIAGAVGHDHDVVAISLAERLRHRGPDGRGHRRFDGCTIAMTRLAILDPTPAADQPMSLGDLHLVFNGEIYNFGDLRRDLEALGRSFRTNGDTEVVLHALDEWGVDALSRLRGMFALAVWDEGERRLLLARDSAGIKPLYLRATPGGLAFASEATPLAALAENRPRVDSLREFLRFGSPVSAPSYDEVAELRPGTVATWRAGSLQVEPFDVDEPEVARPADALLRCVEQQLQSDRPVAVFLGGGFDSALLAATSRAVGVRPAAITLATGGNQADVERARETARHYGLQHEVVTCHAPAVGDYLAAMDQPTVDGLNVLLVSQAAASLGFPVALSGLGGDEVLGGYGYYRRLRRVDGVARAWRHLPPTARAAIAGRVAPLVRRTPGELDDVLRAPDVPSRHRAWRSLLAPDEVVDLTGADAQPSFRWASDPDEPVRRQLAQLDRTTYLEPTLLRDADVFSMSTSVEMRVPLLDERFLAAVAALPAPTRKADLARAVGDRFLVGRATASKLTFSLPWDRWLPSILDGAESVVARDDPWRGVVGEAAGRRFLDHERATGFSRPLRALALVVLASWLHRLPAERRLAGLRA